MKHPQHDNLIIAANDKDALFICYECQPTPIEVDIRAVMNYPNWNWTHVKPLYKYQHVKDAWEADKSLVLQFKSGDLDYWLDLYPFNPSWDAECEYRIKPKKITKRLYANAEGYVKLQEIADPADCYIPISGTDTEEECE